MGGKVTAKPPRRALPQHPHGESVAEPPQDEGARGDSIVLNYEGISGTSTWGRRAALAWNDVASLEFNTGNRNTMVIGKNGAKVCHSGFHLDQPRFEEEVKRRTGLPVKVIQPGTWKPKVSYR